MGFETAAILLSWIAIALLGLALSGLMRQVRWLTTAHQPPNRVGPAIGSPAPALAGVDYSASQLTLLVFMADDCPLCVELMPAAEKLSVTGSQQDVQVIIARIGTDAAGHPGTVRLTEDDLRVWRVSFTPFAVLIADDARIIEAQPVESVESLRALAARRATREEVAA